MDGHRIRAEGIEVFGALTPWSEIRSIILAREPETRFGDTLATPGYWQLIVDFTYGEFVEITEHHPSWQRLLDDLPAHRALLVDDLRAVLTATAPVEIELLRT